MTKFEGFQPELSNEKLSDDTNIREIAIPVGLIDACKLNHAYKQLLDELNMQDYDTEYALLAIKNQIDKHKTGEQSNIQVNADLWHDDNIINADQPVISEKDINAILLWRTSHLSISSIAYKVGI